MRPMPLRASVGAICEMIPPAPTHSTLLFEKTSWSKPGIFLCRSSAPGIAFPRKLIIEVCETVNAGRMIFNSFPIDFDFKVLVQPHEAHEAVAAEDRHHRHVPGALQALLEVLIGARRMRRVGALFPGGCESGPGTCGRTVRA